MKTQTEVVNYVCHLTWQARQLLHTCDESKIESLERLDTERPRYLKCFKGITALPGKMPEDFCPSPLWELREQDFDTLKERGGSEGVREGEGGQKEKRGGREGETMGSGEKGEEGREGKRSGREGEDMGKSGD